MMPLLDVFMNYYNNTIDVLQFKQLSFNPRIKSKNFQVNFTLGST